ncbi:hypothetical protein RHRU231_450143 [Rhodococcus ruber]|uniref:Uncharacterized protein n=2 Tax=Rhodococcus ruber TaxID=1830 RepID=A0A098BMN3_9NOCA|nr:hypothetical protein RHRU231_450143 [Rhodococcus ruber]
MRRERAGVSFETIAGATQYIAELEQENYELKHLREDDKSETVELLVEAENRSRRIEELEAENTSLKARIGSVRDAIMSDNHKIRWLLLEALDGPDV